MYSDDLRTHATLSILVLVAMIAVARGPSAASATEIDPRLFGPDVLGERMVIPPNQPDWVLSDCTPRTSHSQSSYDRLHTALCELAGKKR
jgi:hypothetical protein